MAERDRNPTDEIRLGTMLFTLVEPRRGHEVAYNRWYERDHFYAGCMVGPYQFAGRRWVVTKPLKDLRFPAESPITPDAQTGSYLGLYWVLDGHHDEWNRWAVTQVNKLHANGRMFAERDHIHTLLYRYRWGVFRDGDDGVTAELALDHPFKGMTAVVVDAADGVDRAELERWYREEHLPGLLAGSAAAMSLAFTPMPLLIDAPGDVPRSEKVDNRLMHLFFLDEEPAGGWGTFKQQAQAVEQAGVGRVMWASPFIPTIPGTDTYTDQLW
ncbi:MAG: hypothetical protein ACRDJP_02215 [Actinomycetota bacterium]